MTDEVRQRRARESAEQAERDRIHKIRDRCIFERCTSANS